MEIKARFENGHFKPLEKVSLESGEVVELELIPKNKFKWKGALKNMKVSSIELQHKIKRIW